MTGDRHELTYRADIDGLRAIAVGAVVLFHARVPFVSGGFVGVDVFFVISGYLITTILLRDPSIIGFYQRRARRILPALFVLVAVVLAVGLVLLLPHDLMALARSALATLLFGSNIWFWRQAGYFATETELWPLLHTWSLGVEEQFYIAFPIVVRLCAGIGRRWLVLVFAVLALLSMATAIFCMTHLKPMVAFYIAPMRAWELLAGSIIATGALPIARGRGWRTAAAAVGLALVLGSIVATDATRFPGLGAVPPVLGTVLLIWAGEGERHALSGWLGARPLRFVGLISYSLYLWHWPVLAFARYVAVAPLGPVDTAAAVALAAGLAVLSWRFVERPFRRGVSDRGIWLVSGAGMATLLVAAAAPLMQHGFPGRYPPAVAALNEGEGEDWRCPVTTLVRFGSYFACPLNLPDGDLAKAEVVLWGDSHAQMYAPGLVAALGSRGAVLVTANGCAPVAGDGADPTCGAIQRANFAQIVQLPARTVVLGQNWPQYRDEASARLGRTPLPAERYQDALRRLRTLVAALRAAGKQVVVIGPIALPGYNLASVGARDLAFHGAVRTPTEVARAAYLTEDANVLAALDAMHRSGEAGVVRPDTLICNPRTCPFVVDGRTVFADHGHLTAISARRLAPLFARALAAPPTNRGK